MLLKKCSQQQCCHAKAVPTAANHRRHLDGLRTRGIDRGKLLTVSCLLGFVASTQQELVVGLSYLKCLCQVHDDDL
jgi:hypothetical protein